MKKHKLIVTISSKKQYITTAEQIVHMFTGSDFFLHDSEVGISYGNKKPVYDKVMGTFELSWIENRECQHANWVGDKSVRNVLFSPANFGKADFPMVPTLNIVDVKIIEATNHFPFLSSLFATKEGDKTS